MATPVKITEHLSDQTSGTLDLSSISSSDKANPQSNPASGCAAVAMPVIKSMDKLSSSMEEEDEESMGEESQDDENMCEGPIEIDLNEIIMMREDPGYSPERFAQLQRQFKRVQSYFEGVKKRRSMKSEASSSKAVPALLTRPGSASVTRNRKSGTTLTITKAKRNTSAPASDGHRERSGSSTRRSDSARPKSRERGRSVTDAPIQGKLLKSATGDDGEVWASAASSERSGCTAFSQESGSAGRKASPLRSKKTLVRPGALKPQVQVRPGLPPRPASSAQPVGESREILGTEQVKSAGVGDNAQNTLTGAPGNPGEEEAPAPPSRVNANLTRPRPVIQGRPLGDNGPMDGERMRHLVEEKDKAILNLQNQGLQALTHLRDENARETLRVMSSARQVFGNEVEAHKLHCERQMRNFEVATDSYVSSLREGLASKQRQLEVDVAEARSHGEKAKEAEAQAAHRAVEQADRSMARAQVLYGEQLAHEQVQFRASAFRLKSELRDEAAAEVKDVETAARAREAQIAAEAREMLQGVINQGKAEMGGLLANHRKEVEQFEEIRKKDRSSRERRDCGKAQIGCQPK